jgi:hypothetical protein
MLELLKSVLVQYKTLIVKMSQDNHIIVQAKLKFDILCDIRTLLTLFCLLPLLAFVNALIKLLQGKDVFNSYFVTSVKVFHVDFL